MMTKNKLVLSASRRVELLHLPQRFIKKLDEYPPSTVHSIVLWTKTPQLLFQHQELRKRLLEYDQIFCHLTITGLGASFLEPNTRPSQETIDLLPKMIDFVGIPERVNIRFDPILNLNHKDGKTLSNFHLFPKIAEQCKEHGITEFTFSWMTAYKKVQRRLEALGFERLEATSELKTKQVKQLNAWSKEFSVNVKGFCTEPFYPSYGCINGTLLTQLHPKKEQCTLEKPSGQRALCACTKSRDIGWYYSCPNGCAYCYGQAKFDLNQSYELMVGTIYSKIPKEGMVERLNRFIAFEKRVEEIEDPIQRDKERTLWKKYFMKADQVWRNWVDLGLTSRLNFYIHADEIAQEWEDERKKIAK
jgi:DNA repair photolyase